LCWKNNWQTTCAYSHLSIWHMFSWKSLKWTCHLRGNSWLLLLMIKFALSSKKLDLWKTSATTVNLTASQGLKIFLMRSMVFIISDMIWMERNGQERMKCINIWKIYVIHWTMFFKWPISDITKSCLSKRSIQNTKESNWH
jgi:hypothetical protein